MAKKPALLTKAGFYSVVYILVFTTSGLFSSVDGVWISPVQNPIRAKYLDAYVTLPCEFTTRTTESPEVTWYHETDLQRSRVVTIDRSSRLMSYNEFVNRVSRGNKGSLVLIKPSGDDSGTYTCEVTVRNENPPFAKTEMTLIVVHETTAKEFDPHHITPTLHPVEVKDTEPVAILPCNYTAAVPKFPEVIWREDRNGSSKQIAHFYDNGSINVSEEFHSRIGRGDKGNMLLIKPTVFDSGNYTCMVNVNRIQKQYAKSQVRLSVVHDKSLNKSITDNIWTVVLLCVGWSLSVLSALLMNYNRELIRQKTSRSTCNYAALYSVSCLPFFVLATILLITSNFYTAYFSRSLTSQEKEHSWLVCLSTVLVAVGILCVLVVVNCILQRFWLRFTVFQSTASQNEKQQDDLSRNTAQSLQYKAETNLTAISSKGVIWHQPAIKRLRENDTLSFSSDATNTKTLQQKPKDDLENTYDDSDGGDEIAKAKHEENTRTGEINDEIVPLVELIYRPGTDEGNQPSGTNRDSVRGFGTTLFSQSANAFEK